MHFLLNLNRLCKNVSLMERVVTATDYPIRSSLLQIPALVVP